MGLGRPSCFFTPESTTSGLAAAANQLNCVVFGVLAPDIPIPHPAWIGNDQDVHMFEVPPNCLPSITTKHHVLVFLTASSPRLALSIFGSQQCQPGSSSPCLDLRQSVSIISGVPSQQNSGGRRRMATTLCQGSAASRITGLYPYRHRCTMAARDAATMRQSIKQSLSLLCAIETQETRS